MGTVKNAEQAGQNQHDINKYSRKNTIRFLIVSFSLLLLTSVGAFISLGKYMSSASEKSITTLGSIYMSGINEHITAHFRTLIDLKLEQAEAIVNVVSKDTDGLYDELVYRANARNFNSLALCAEDGSMQMFNGSQIRLADPEPFYESLRNKEKKVAVGVNNDGSEVVVFGVNASYPMSNGEMSMALLAAVPIEYINAMLATDEEEKFIYSHIIRKDGSFIVSDLSESYNDYFESLYKRYPEENAEEIGEYIQELSDYMEKGSKYTKILQFSDESFQVYCTKLPDSEWYLLTILPFKVMSETVEALDKNRMAATMFICAVIALVILLIFYIYYKMTCRQLDELKAAREEALEATKAKSLFLSNMSHDIRTPMNAIVGMTAIAMTHIDDKDQVRNCLKKITLSGKHLLGLINDVLDMSKIESGKMTLTAERISLREVVEGVVSIVQPQIRGRNQSFNVHIENIISEDVYCDSIRLNQILLNLLSNAIKYTHEGGTIMLSLFQEDISGIKDDNYIRTHIIVKDNGIGMTEEFLHRVFDSYERADSKRVHKTEGAGLGMAITKCIVDAMQGDITVTSELDKGSEFHVVLDFEKADCKEIDMVLPPWKMLVVDDDKELCRTAVEALDSIGIKADWTLSGEMAVKMVEERYKARDEYQIILLDWKLPDMDGIATAKHIRKIVGAEMPIILISAYDWNEFEIEAKDAGINGFIAKLLFQSTLFYGLKKYMGIDDVQDETLVDSDLKGCRILAAEDNDLNWEILHELLLDMGIESEWAENGQICVDMFQNSQQGYYDAILMDVRMPVMGGYEATESIRALSRPDAQTIPIIAMTADAFSEDVKRCLDSGMNAHTAKPVNLDELISLLRKFILQIEA